MKLPVGVIGAGLVGRGWAIVFARGGHSVRLYDPLLEQSSEARGDLDRWFERTLVELEELDLLNGDSAAAVRARIHGETRLDIALTDVCYVQENTPERLSVKRAVFEELDRIAPPGAVLASSTSGFLPSELFDGLPGAARCLVAHPLNPPYLVPAVELAPSPRTSGDVMDRTVEILAGCGQRPLRMKHERQGFLMNRLQGALYHEAFRLLRDDCCDPADIEGAIRDGLSWRWSVMGPMETADLNAPGGIRDFVARYGPLYREIGLSQNELAEWGGETLDRVDAELRSRRSVEELSDRRDWRDRMLMESAAFRRRSRLRFGE